MQVMVQAVEEESVHNTNNNLTSEEIPASRTRQEINESNKTVHSFCVSVVVYQLLLVLS